MALTIAITIINLFPMFLLCITTVLMVAVCCVIFFQNYRLNLAAATLSAGVWLCLLIGVVWHDGPRAGHHQVFVYSFFGIVAFLTLRKLLFKNARDKAYEQNRKLIGLLFGGGAARAFAASIERYKQRVLEKRPNNRSF